MHLHLQASTDTPMPYALRGHRCSTNQGTFVHPGFVIAMRDGSVTTTGASIATRASGSLLTTKASHWDCSYPTTAGSCMVDYQPLDGLSLMLPCVTSRNTCCCTFQPILLDSYV